MDYLIHGIHAFVRENCIFARQKKLINSSDG